MKNYKKPFISIASGKDCLADQCRFGVNNAATDGKLDADLTQPVSPSVRRQLLHLSSVYQRVRIWIIQFECRDFFTAIADKFRR